MAEDIDTCVRGNCPQACVPQICGETGDANVVVHVECGLEFEPAPTLPTYFKVFDEATCNRSKFVRSFNTSECIPSVLLTENFWVMPPSKRFASTPPRQYFRIVCDDLGTYAEFHGSSTCTDANPVGYYTYRVETSSAPGCISK